MDTEERKSEETPHKSSKVGQKELEESFGNLLKGWSIGDNAKKEFFEKKIATEAPFSVEISPPKNTTNILDTNKIVKESFYIKPEPLRDKKSIVTNAQKEINGFIKLDRQTEYYIRTLTLSEQAVYRILYRDSYGWGKNSCAVGYTKLSNECNCSIDTVRRALRRLSKRGWVEPVTTSYSSPTVYRIYLPKEVIENTQHIINMSTPSKMQGDSNLLGGSKMQGDSNLHTDEVAKCKEGGSNLLGGSKPTTSDKSLYGNEIDVSQKAKSCAIEYIYNNIESPPTPPKGENGGEGGLSIKENKETLVNIVQDFYLRIGEEKISSNRIERGVLILDGLLKEKYSMEEIKYTIGWTLLHEKGRIKNIKILEETISQALRDFKAKKQAEVISEKMAKEKEEREKEFKKVEEEEKINHEIDGYIKTLSEEERKNIEEIARKKVKESGVDEKVAGFETLVLIERRKIIKRMREQNNYDK